MAVSLRLLRALGDISTTTADQEIRRTLTERGRRIVAGCAENLGEVELRDMRARLVVLENSLTPPSA
jgi:RNase P/RNase MRP subunit POP5